MADAPLPYAAAVFFSWHASRGSSNWRLHMPAVSPLFYFILVYAPFLCLVTRIHRALPFCPRSAELLGQTGDILASPKLRGCASMANVSQEYWPSFQAPDTILLPFLALSAHSPFGASLSLHHEVCTALASSICSLLHNMRSCGGQGDQLAGCLPWRWHLPPEMLQHMGSSTGFPQMSLVSALPSAPPPQPAHQGSPLHGSPPRLHGETPHSFCHPS